MSLLLYINGQLTDLDAGTVIAQTKQVNDLNSIDNRQANYTNKFKLPKTANNMRIMQFLTLPGNASNVPYQKNECSLYSHTGECFVYKGWAVVTDGGDSYDVAVYDGIIDLYKAIENKTLADVGLQQLDHIKNVSAVINSWQNTSLPYRYILADYNGDTGLTNGTPGNTQPQVNIDYLVPSVNVAWLWNKIFEEFNNGIQPGGSVFLTQAFKQLWMTFPKGQVRTETSDVSLFKCADYHFIQSTSYPAERKTYYAKFISTSVYNSELLSNTGGIHLKVLNTATYKLKIKAKLYGHRDRASHIHKDSYLKIGKNCENIIATRTGNNIINIFDQEPYLIYGEEFEATSNPFQLNAYDSICMVIGGQGTDSYELNENWPGDEFEAELIRTDPLSIDFSTALTDFSIKDFMNEVVHRFGLTLFKDKFSSDYTFLTLQEQLQAADVADWSSKFVKKVTENYTNGSYAKKNWFKYAYNDKESTHNDGYIGIENVNLSDTRDVIKSKIYSPERIPTRYLGYDSNVYKLWEKETVENPEPDEPTVTYKALDKRYYFINAAQNTNRPIIVRSNDLNIQSTTSAFYSESYYGLKFQEIINQYYAPLQSVLNRAVTITAQLWLTDVDIANFDFKKLYYIEQLSSYFLVNKINNYIPGKITQCELVRVQNSSIPPAEPTIEISSMTTSDPYFYSYGNTFIIDYTAWGFIPPIGINNSLVAELSADGSTAWKQASQPITAGSQSFTSPQSFIPLPYIRLRHISSGTVSNVFQFNF
ncbi:hypothetical protein GR160_08610 [Flavobacterium sp. Sd200]|uniref:hypothetical protein n=1 Tax=Flavobacterium sp. Sd200 TaxID=2692211 RepID=UPI00136B6E79|nr:hypothetical protein [Flavobacterium sp. Sd200]MXN91289.1 hypothetical protein [Flavobacterium sp. Sd200]